MSSASSSSGFIEYFDGDFGNAADAWASRASDRAPDESAARLLFKDRSEMRYAGHSHWHVLVAAVGMVESGEATASRCQQKRRSRGRRPWPMYAPRPPLQNQRVLNCADRVPRGLWGSLCGSQEKSLLLRGYGYCLRSREQREACTAGSRGGGLGKVAM